MPVALMPPITSGHTRPVGAVPLNRAARYVRGPGHSRWHRPRSAYREQGGGTVMTLWCGQSAFDGLHGRPALLRRDRVDGRLPVCGTCEGRALGAGQDDVPADLPELVFAPRWFTRPRLCPGSGSDRLIGDPPVSAQGIGLCLACGDLIKIRAVGSPYHPGYGLQRHPPGPNLVAPCPWHAWHHIDRVAGGRAGCRCGWPPAKPGKRRRERP